MKSVFFMECIAVFYLILFVTILHPASAVTPTHGKYSSSRLGYEVTLPSGAVCMRAEPDRGCGLLQKFVSGFRMK